MQNKVSITRTLDAPIDKTWQAWTDADKLKQWFSSQTNELNIIEFDVKPGGKVRFTAPGSAKEYTWTYLVVDEPNEIVFDILDFTLPDYPEGIGGICHLEFTAKGDKTDIMLWGELPDESMREEYQSLIEGWDGTFSKLNQYLIEES